MRDSSGGRYAAAIAFSFTLVIGCNDAAAPNRSVDASDRAFAEALGEEVPGEGIPFADLRLFFEFNSTDNDLGVQLHLDAQDWKRVAAFDPGNRRIFDITGQGRLRELGLTELFFESAEPSPQEVLALLPPGNYRFVGRTVENERLVGTATLSHELPPAPTFSPSNGESVDRNNVVIVWNTIPGIAGIQLIVADEELGATMTIDLLPSVTRFHVPPVFLRPGTDYKAEVLAIAANGNKTIAEGTFVTRGSS